MKKFSVNCDFGGQIAPFSVYIGAPEGTHHPLHFQADWLSKTRGGNVTQEIMESIIKLKDIADRNNVLLEDLFTYALGAAEQEKDENNSTDESAEETDDEDFSDEVLSLNGEDSDEESKKTQEPI